MVRSIVLNSSFGLCSSSKCYKITCQNLVLLPPLGTYEPDPSAGLRLAQPESSAGRFICPPRK
jgi:hypothetical protein